MKIRCLHGFFLIDDSSSGDISRFMNLFNVSLVPYGEHFTFDFLSLAPDYALRGKTYLGAAVSKTIEGPPDKIMRLNGLVYDFNSSKVVPIITVTQSIQLYKASNYYLAEGLILPGSVMADGSRVTDYSARYLFDSGKFRYSEVTVV